MDDKSKAMTLIAETIIAKKFNRAVEEAFGLEKPNIVMTADTVKEEQEKLRRIEEEKKIVGALRRERWRRGSLTKEQVEQLATGKIPPMPGDELPVKEWMRLRGGAQQTATEEAQAKDKAGRERQAAALRGMAQLQGAMNQQYAQQNDAMRQAQMAQVIYGTAMYSTGPILNPDPPKPRKPKAPDKTTEQAQEELTGIGKRKIIVDGENNP